MIDVRKKELAITIQTDSPVETLMAIQIGIIEVARTLLSIGNEGSDLVLDRPTSNGVLSMMDLLHATLIDPVILETTMCITDQVTSFKNQVSHIRTSLSEVLPVGTTFINEAESWPVERY